MRTEEYLRVIGVPEIPPATSPFDPGYDPVTVESHLEQSAHLISILKLSMACWILANEQSTRRKVDAARRRGIPTVTGGGPFEIALREGHLPAYLDLCADAGFTRIECGRGFTDVTSDPWSISTTSGSHAESAASRSSAIRPGGRSQHQRMRHRTGNIDPGVDEKSRRLFTSSSQLLQDWLVRWA